jgi:hypothetical protein
MPDFYEGAGSSLNRNAPFGTAISNRAPLPRIPVSLMEMQVIDRISQERERPSPVFFAPGIF